MVETITQTPEENLGNPETETPETLSEGTGQEGTPAETIDEGAELSPEIKIKGLEQKFSASSKEALRLLKENKQLKAKLESNSSGEPPSDVEAARIVPDYDLLSPAEQHLHKEQIMLKRQLAKLGEAVYSQASQLTSEKKIEELAQKFPSIKKEDFRNFCDGQEPSETLAKAFLFDQAKELGAKEEAEKRARKGLESGSGGERKIAPKGLTIEEREKMRVGEPVRYGQLIRDGKI